MRRIVLLVGANSSGKSSLLRFFPLLRQTEEARSSSPLLWYSEHGYVDFGDFKSALFRGAERQAIEVSARVAISDPRWLERWQRHFPRELQTGKRVAELHFSAQISGNDERAAVVGFEVRLFHDKAVMQLDPAGNLIDLTVNGRPCPELPPLAASFGSLIPEFSNPVAFSTFGKNILLAEVKKLIHGNTTDFKVQEIAGCIRHRPASLVLADMKDVSSKVGGVKKWESNVQRIQADSAAVLAIKRAVFIQNLEGYLSILREVWRDLALGVRYIGPFRRAPERYYRKEAIAVQEITQVGDNLAMFLWSLTDADREAFSNWVHEHFGFGVIAKAEGAHVVLSISPSTAQSSDFNLVDMGFGISQLLPVVAQCWISSRNLTRRASMRGERQPSLLAIEQPELHLHPHHQYGLADLFTSLATALRSTNTTMPIVIETHSEAMLHRFGEIVEEGRLSRDDIAVLLFHKEPDGKSSVQQVFFNTEGVLENWPIGFFRT